ncbi:MAG: glycosyltransferase [Sedimentisphaerales bacterium]|nr:glycosyltransferase [Sedimentisphaerales bacterium]
MPGKATICIVNYKTLDFTRLCLRSIRKFTDYPYEMLVVDNDSNDDSTAYLRSLKWIRLIERPHPSGQPRGSFDQSAALDLGLKNCDNEFFVAMHTDAFVQHPGWLTELVSHFKNDPKIACVGSGKIELTPRWLQLLKKYTDYKALLRSISSAPQQREQLRYYNRTICCLYRTEVLRKEGLSFLMGNSEGFTAGQKLYYELLDRGYQTVELHPSVMGRYIAHIAHATQVINPQEFKLRAKTNRKFTRLADKILSSPVIQGIISDDSLDS